MDIRMKFTSLLLSLLLISCGGGSDNPATANLDPNKIHVKIFESTESGSKPLEGIVVQLDYNGENIKSDSNGIVTFNVPDINKHDIHILPPGNYDWHSIYNAKKGILYEFFLTNMDRIISAPKQSFLSFSGTIENYVQNNSYEFYFYNTKSEKVHIGFNNNTNLNSTADYAIDFNFNLPAGSSVTGDILIEEYQWDVNSVEKILVDSVVLPSITLNTQLTTTNVISKNIPLLAIKPQQSNILTVNNLSIPNGFTFSYFSLLNENNEKPAVASKPSEEFYSYSNNSWNLVLPKVFQSYSSYNYTSVMVTVGARILSSTYELDWYIDSIVPRNSTISINPIITVFPDFPDNQSGEEINWNRIDQKLARLYLNINSINPAVTPQLGWSIQLDPKATKIRLPQIPAGITPKLVVGQKYRIRLRGRYRNGDIIESFYLTSNNSWAR